MGNSAKVVILCEDRHHATFARRVLQDYGIQPRELRVVPLPASGGGINHVKSRYVDEVREIRSRASRMTVALVVIIDADSDAPSERHEFLSMLLKEVGEPERSSSERIVHLIPKRHIETWVHYLLGSPVDEELDYKEKTAADVRNAAGKMVGFCSTGVVAHEPKSLRSACLELQKLRP